MVDQSPGKMTGADIFFEALRREGVDTIFGYPGGAVLLLFMINCMMWIF